MVEMMEKRGVGRRQAGGKRQLGGVSHWPAADGGRRDGYGVCTCRSRLRTLSSGASSKIRFGCWLTGHHEIRFMVGQLVFSSFVLIEKYWISFCF